MKRKPITYPQIKKIKPLFWKECMFCGREFKNEWGYKVMYGNYNLYCCDECGKNAEKAEGIKVRGKNFRPVTASSPQRIWVPPLVKNEKE